MSVRWIVSDKTEKVCKDTFQIISQGVILIPPKEYKTLSTHVGVEIANGMVIVSVNTELKTKLTQVLKQEL